jgi:parvulin-like peptidyl-prolyl isomerase
MSTSSRSKEEAAKLAALVGAKAKQGADFAALVTEYSEHQSSKKVDGDMGTFGRDDLPERFTEVAFALEPGQIGGPVETQIGFHVIKRIE